MTCHYTLRVMTIAEVQNNFRQMLTVICSIQFQKMFCSIELVLKPDQDVSPTHSIISISFQESSQMTKRHSGSSSAITITAEIRTELRYYLQKYFSGVWYFEKVYFAKDTYLCIALCYSINHFTLQLIRSKNDQHKTPIFNISASSILYRRLHRNRKNTILFQPRWL